MTFMQGKVAWEQYTKRPSKVSQRIAQYLMDHGTNPHPKFPGSYEIEFDIADGRGLSASFSNVNERPVESPMRNCTLEFHLTPVRDNQFGFRSTEYGLTGKFELFQIILGLPNRLGFPEIIGFHGDRFSTEPLDEYQRVQIFDIQKRYIKFRKWVLEELRRDGGEK